MGITFTERSLLNMLELEHAIVDEIVTCDCNIRFLNDRLVEIKKSDFRCDLYEHDILRYSKKIEEARARKNRECERLKSVREDMREYFKELMQEAET